MSDPARKAAPRSYLFVPGDRPERFEKALASGADRVIIDLEDAVAPDAKESARDSVAGVLVTSRDYIVRVNSPDTPWFEDDLIMCRQGKPRAVVIPKAEDPAQIESVAGQFAGEVGILPLIETARGVRNVEMLAAAAGVERLVFGSIDLQLDLGIDGERLLDAFRLQLVLASRLAGIDAPVDGVTTALDDRAQLEDDVSCARKLGFTAKLAIHPRQVAAINSAFVPSAVEIDWAERVVAAVRDAGSGAVSLDGKMIDKPVIARAERLLAIAAAYGDK